LKKGGKPQKKEEKREEFGKTQVKCDKNTLTHNTRAKQRAAVLCDFCSRVKGFCSWFTFADEVRERERESFSVWFVDSSSLLLFCFLATHPFCLFVCLLAVLLGDLSRLMLLLLLFFQVVVCFWGGLFS